MKKISKIIGVLFALVLVFTENWAFAADQNIEISKDNGKAPGNVSIKLDEEFENASIVWVKGEGVDTKAVVACGEVEFYTPNYGKFNISSTGKTIKDYFSENLQSETMYDYAYKGKGTAEDPFVVLSTFADVPMEKFKLQAAWKGYNVLAGYTGLELYLDDDYIRSYDKNHVYVLRCEDRDKTTGKLRGAFVINGNLWTFVNGRDKGPYYMNYMIDPTDRFITSGYALDNHYLYNENVSNAEERKAEAVKKLKNIRDSKTSSLFFQYRMRNYSGPIKFSVYVGDSGKFMSGDTVSIHYLLGSGDRNLYHQTKPTPEELIRLEPTYRKFYQDKGVTSVVNENGFLDVMLYNGGYFELRNETSIKDGREVTIKDKQYDMVTLTDVDKSHWAYSSIYEQLKKSYMSAEGGNFKPEVTINRADFIKTLTLSCGITIQTGKELSFEDVRKGNPYYDYIFTAYSLGITSGVTETSFGAEKGITREMAAVLICRALKIAPKTDSFLDNEDVSSWAKGYAGACKEAGYLNGYTDGSFGPKKILTRAEAASIMERIYKDLKKDA